MMIIDEAQNFENSVKDGQIVMTELVSAFNMLRAPLLFLGTNKAYRVFGKDFRSARRAVVVPIAHWDRLPQYPQEGTEDEWLAVVTILWTLQWVRNPCELDEWTIQVLYDCTQGVLAILVALFVGAQMRAMHNGTERVTPELIQQVYDSLLKPVHPMIDALRDNDRKALELYQDIAPPLQQQLWGPRGVLGGGLQTANTSHRLSSANQSVSDSREMAVDATESKPKRSTPRRTRVPTAASARRGKPNAAAETSTDVELEATDYRNASRAAATGGTTALDELRRRGQAPSIEDILGLD
jgi:hypothetical protein